MSFINCWSNRWGSRFRTSKPPSRVRLYAYIIVFFIKRKKNHKVLSRHNDRLQIWLVFTLRLFTDRLNNYFYLSSVHIAVYVIKSTHDAQQRNIWLRRLGVNTRGRPHRRRVYDGGRHRALMTHSKPDSQERRQHQWPSWVEDETRKIRMYITHIHTHERTHARTRRLSPLRQCIQVTQWRW